jgi:peptide/nickel transport system substrate-binding protein
LWKEGVKLIYLRNENYFEKNASGEKIPFLDAVEISFISDKQSAFIEFLKGNLDFLSGNDASYKDELLTRSGNLQEKYNGRFKMETQPYLNTEYLGIMVDLSQPKINPLQNKLIRQALNYGFDRRKMMTYLRNNIGTAATSGFVPTGLPSFDSSAVKGYDYDPEKSRELLKQAGYENGKGLPEITMSTTTTYTDLCEYIKSQWENIGFKIKIDVNQAAVHRKMVAEQKLSFFRGSWIADYPDAENYLALFYSKNFAPNGPNFTHFSNPLFDELYEKASVEVNDSLRYRLYREMDQLVMNEAPVVVLYYDKVLRLTQNTIDGLGSNAMNLLVLKNVKKKK